MLDVPDKAPFHFQDFGNRLRLLPIRFNGAQTMRMDVTNRAGRLVPECTSENIGNRSPRVLGSREEQPSVAWELPANIRFSNQAS